MLLSRSNQNINAKPFIDLTGAIATSSASFGGTRAMKIGCSFKRADWVDYKKW